MTTKRKTQKQSNTQPVYKTPEIAYDESHKVTYSNVAQVLQNLYDFRLTFGLLSGKKNDRTQISGLQTIIITPQHAKQLAALLTENVRIYEEQFMPLPIPIGKEETETDETEVDETVN